MMKRAAEIAVSGGHNLLMVGPPGAGKTMIAERIPSIMPMLSREQSLEVARIFSVYGDMKNGGEYIYERPFRSPHHSIPPTALVGGGVTPKPGEISLAHHGVLFLDELTEFQRRTIEMLRLPLEQKRISHCRNNISLQFPSDFMLIAAMNPCPCGYFPNKLKCQCTPAQIQRYLSKLSYALLDRIDIVAQVEEISYQMICNGNIENESSEVIRKRVEAACLIQEKRYNKEGITKNAQMDLSHIQKWCQLEEDANSFFKDVFQARNLTSRGYFRILRVARTIADLESSECVLLSHIQEAVAYRLNDKDYMNNREGLL